MKTISTVLTQKSSQLYLRIFLAFIIVLTANTLLLSLSAKTIKTWNLSQLQIQFLESSFITIGIGLGIWMLRTYFDKGNPVSIGVTNIKRSLLSFLLGFGLLLVPLMISLSITQLAGWAEIKVNWQEAQIGLIVLGMLSVFITDAFPEELVFRGYIFSNLLTKFVKWKSAILTTLLFVIYPIIYFPVKKLFGSDLTTGLVTGLSIGYIGYMLFFGAFAIYLRILTNSIWTGLGFHLMFVYMNQLIGLEDHNLFQFNRFSNELLIQLSFIILLILTFVLLIVYPKLRGITLDWKGHSDE